RIIGLAQIRSETGAIERNVRLHLSVLHQLGPGAVDLVVFPELSLSNYDPTVAKACAVHPKDDRLAPLRSFAEGTGIAVAVGAPLAAQDKPQIALLTFTPGGPPRVVGKRYLHEDETPFFAPSRSSAAVLHLAVPIGVAICYEISVATHTKALIDAGASVYLASVAKTLRGVVGARDTLSETARQHRVPALMVNSVGTCEGKKAGGGSMVIDREGRLVGRLGDTEEAVLFYDTESGEAAAFRYS
ncbi:MAG: carbon-nitrogen hydrolase family protein, partial [Acidobacteriota bacterium]